MGVALCGDAPRDPWAGGLGSEASFLLVPWGQGHPRGTQSVGLGRPLAEGRCWAPPKGTQPGSPRDLLCVPAVRAVLGFPVPGWGFPFSGDLLCVWGSHESGKFWAGALLFVLPGPNVSSGLFRERPPTTGCAGGSEGSCFSFHPTFWGKGGLLDLLIFLQLLGSCCFLKLVFFCDLQHVLTQIHP